MRIEIVPKNDIQGHLQGGICKCWPNLIFESGSIIVVHNAYDGRVAVENAKDILNINQVPEQWEIFIEQ